MSPNNSRAEREAAAARELAAGYAEEVSPDDDRRLRRVYLQEPVRETVQERLKRESQETFACYADGINDDD